MMTQFYGIYASLSPEKGYPDSKVYGANMGPACGRQDPCWPHVVSMDLAIWVANIAYGGISNECMTFIFMIEIVAPHTPIVYLDR